MKVIFLDIDGVLMTGRYRRLLDEQADRLGPFVTDSVVLPFDPICLMQLKKVTEAADAYIVITSSWRMYRGCNPYWNSIVEQLRGSQLEERLLDVTPVLKEQSFTAPRWKEIEYWLDERARPVDAFVILDDMTDMGPLQPFLVCCHPDRGFDEERAQQALLHLVG